MSNTEYLAQFTDLECGTDLALFVTAGNQGDALMMAKDHFHLKGGEWDANAGFLVLNGAAQLMTITETDMMNPDFIKRLRMRETPTVKKD